MNTFEIKIDGMDALAQKLKGLEKNYPETSLKYTKAAGNKFKQEYLKRLKSRVKKRKGNLIKGAKAEIRIASGEGYSYCVDIYGGKKKAAHFHLIEHGHKREEMPFFAWNKLCWATDGFTEGFHMMEDTTKDWQENKKLLAYCEKMIKEILKKGGAA